MGNGKDKRLAQVVSLSGGMASFAVASLVVDEYGLDSTTLVFCDTTIEDADLYRFLVKGAAALSGLCLSDRLSDLCVNVPSMSDPDRQHYLSTLAKAAMAEIPRLVWLSDGRDPWRVFKDVRYQGNSRTAHCTVELKGKVFAKWLTAKYSPDECVLHFGFDWKESHRLDTAAKNWAPYCCKAVLVDPPYLNRAQVFQIAEDLDLEIPRLYALGFTHNNCGGFCVKAGQAHFANLLSKLPEVYAYHEGKQQRLMEEVPTVRPFLRMVRDKTTEYLTLRDFREHLEQSGLYNTADFGGCGCFGDAGVFVSLDPAGGSDPAAGLV